jgi:glycosyltransferase involved in cell wall biosynthesis
VTTNVGVASEFENGREIVIAEPNVEDFARALGDLLESDVRRKDLGINFCRAVEAHIDTKEAYLAKLSEGWLKLIKKSS